MEKSALQIRKEELKQELDEIIKQEYKDYRKKHLRRLKNKYENTYWKTENGYNGEERWPLFVFFEKVTTVYEGSDNIATAACSGIRIQIDCNGCASIDPDDHMYVSGYEIPSSKEEFEECKDRIRKILSDIGEAK